MSPVSSSPPRAPPIKYTAPLGTRWAKETAAAGGIGAFDLPTDPKNIGPWILGECVGKGASGRVKIAKHRLTGQLAAVKILPIAPLVTSRASLATQQAKSEKQRLGIDREITMMKLMNHPNIMRIYDVFEGDKELFLVLEYVEGGELFDFLVNRGRLPPTEALAYFKQIVYGLNYAHTFSIIHRDLKPENILIASISPPLIKIADWGMAAFAPPSLQLETSCGSPHYASPEIVNGQRYQGNATDIWSCGVILYALLTGRLPFDDKNVRTLLGKVKSGKYDMPAWIDPLAKDLLSRMLVVDVNKRITVPEILSHPWLHAFSGSASSPEQKAMELATAQLPPSPSILARPLTSPSEIDPELLSSLRVIWGRHTDVQGESIKRDLCSPAGCGVHAKAFYFLLGRYREDSLRKNYDETRGQEDQFEGKFDMGSMKFNLGWELDMTSVNKKYGGNRSSVFLSKPPTHSRAPSPGTVPISGLGPPATHPNTRSKSRERAPSPAGPRAPPPQVTGRTGMDLWRAQAHVLDDRKSRYSVHSPKPMKPSGIGRGGPQPPPTRREYTYSHPAENVSTVQFPQHLQTQGVVDQQRPKTSTGLPSKDANMFATVPAPRTIPTNVSPTIAATFAGPGPIIHTPVSLLSASKHLLEIKAVDLDLQLSLESTSDAEPDTTVEEKEEAGSVAQSLAVALDAKSALDMLITPTSMDTALLPIDRTVSRAQDASDKENQGIGEDSGRNHISPEEHKEHGVGLGMGRDVGRNMGNVTNLRDSVGGFKGKKEKKPRPPTLDFLNLNQQRRSTMPTSPITLSPVIVPSSRLLASPVVGEVKGWFSNLFNWKGQPSGHGGILYSPNDIFRTRADVGRILERFGVTVEGGGFDKGMSPVDCAGTLKCHLEEPSGGWTHSNVKSVRFRVEFSFAPNNADAGHQDSYFLVAPAPNQEFLPVPIANSGSSTTPKTRNSILMGNRGRNATPVASPALDIEFPPGFESAIIMIYEKGSVSSFRTVWRRLKDVYGGGATAFPSFSPAMVSTPMAEHPERLST